MTKRLNGFALIDIAGAVALSVASSVSPAAAAGEIASVDMTAQLVDERGQNAKDMSDRAEDDPKCDRCAPLTMGRAIKHALMASFPDEREITFEQRFARGVLSQRIENDKAAKLTANEVALIERLLTKAYGGLVLMQIAPKIDPNLKPVEVKP